MSESDKSWDLRLNTKSKEHHQFQFRDQKIPARVFFLLKHKVISRTDLLICLLINALTKPQGDQDGRGCFATNRYIASGVSDSLSKENISDRIQILIKKGILLKVIFQGERFLEVEWARTPEEIRSIPGEYGELLREVHKKLAENQYRDEGGTWKPVGGILGNQYEGVPGNQYHKSNDGKRKINKTNRETSEVSREGLDLSRNGVFFPDQVKQEYSPLDMECATSLHKALEKANKIQKKFRITSWAKVFQRMRLTDNIPVNRIINTLEWYTSHLTDDYTPRAYSAEGFRDKFPNIESSMKKYLDKNPPVPELGAQDRRTVKQILPILQEWEWPGDSHLQLPLSLSRSVQMYRWFRNGLGKIKRRQDLQFFAETLQEDYISFDIWYRDILEKVANWEKWNGDLKPFEFNPENNYTKQWGRRYAKKYTGGNSDLWDKLVEEVKRVQD